MERHYIKRAAYFNMFLEFVRHAEREILFLKVDILTIINEYIKTMNNAPIEVFNEARSCITKGEQVKISVAYLNENERCQTANFFNGISKLTNDQNKYFRVHENELLEKIDLVNKQKKEKGELGKKLCILVGIVLVIVII
jgi:hypothetical protein